MRSFFLALAGAVIVLWFGIQILLFVATGVSDIPWTLRDLLAVSPLVMIWLAIGYYLISIFMTELTIPGSKWIRFNPVVWYRAVRG